MSYDRKPIAGTRLTPAQEDQKWLRMVDQEDRAVATIRASADGKYKAKSKLEFLERERARGTPFATHEAISDSAFNKLVMRNVSRLRLDGLRPQTGSTRSSRSTARTGTSRSSRSTTRTSRTLRSTGQSSLFSLDSSASNLTQIAMERIDKLERELEEQRRQREEAQKEMELLKKIVEENTAREKGQQ